jgi:hypothetical protein
LGATQTLRAFAAALLLIAARVDPGHYEPQLDQLA